MSCNIKCSQFPKSNGFIWKSVCVPLFFISFCAVWNKLSFFFFSFGETRAQARRGVKNWREIDLNCVNLWRYIDKPRTQKSKNLLYRKLLALERQALLYQGSIFYDFLLVMDHACQNGSCERFPFFLGLLRSTWWTMRPFFVLFLSRMVCKVTKKISKKSVYMW